MRFLRDLESFGVYFERVTLSKGLKCWTKVRRERGAVGVRGPKEHGWFPSIVLYISQASKGEDRVGLILLSCGRMVHCIRRADGTSNVHSEDIFQ